MLLRTLLAVSVVIGTVSVAPAQTAATTPTAPTVAAEASSVDGGAPTFNREETPKQRVDRLGTSEDPGFDPDPDKVWLRFGKTYIIEKYERRWAVYDQEPGFVRPFGLANVTKELYQHNEKWVWVWQEKRTSDGAARETARILEEDRDKDAAENPEQIAYLKMMRPEFEALMPASSPKSVRFEESSGGLPTIGSFRNSPAIADMNADGHLDIVVPSERVSGAATPLIFLGDSKGNWNVWTAVRWPYGVQYGGVAAADFNKDGHMDVAFAVHLTGVRVMLGDSKGTFVDASGGMASDHFPTRRLAVTDLDLDGSMDILAISEGPIVKELRGKTYGKMRAYLNREGGKRWEGMDASDPKNVFGGDWLAVGKFNSDRYPDFVGASLFFHGSQILHLSTGKGAWRAVDTTRGDVVPFMSYYMAVGAGRFSSKNLDDAVLSYVRFWPNEVAKDHVPAPAALAFVGLDRVTFTGKTPRRIPIARWAATRPITGLAEGDFDGDGKLDLLISPGEPREFMLFLGDGKGGFTRADISGMAAMQNTNYDVTVADVNGDKRPDVVVMYESSAGGVQAAHEGRSISVHDGSIRVFLNRGTGAPSALAVKSTN